MTGGVEDTRLVAMTKRQRHLAEHGDALDMLTLAQEMLAGYELAPAKPAEAIVEWFNKNFVGAEDDRGSVLNGADEILVALGFPARDAT